MFRPIGLPLPISDPTRRFYTFIEELPVGSVVLIANGAGIGSYPEMGTQLEAIYTHLMRRPLKFIIYSTGSDPWVAFTTITYVSKGKPESYGKVYGEDYVELGVVPGTDEVIAAALLSSFSRTCPTDARGNPLASLPLMQRVQTGHEISLFIYISGLPPADVIRTVYGVWKIPFMMATQALEWVDCIGFMGGGQMVGALNSTRGAAEYELLLGAPGKAVKTTDMLSMTFMAILVLPIIRNIVYFSRKLRGGK
jgi:hypothetical protein